MSINSLKPLFCSVFILFSVSLFGQTIEHSRPYTGHLPKPYAKNAVRIDNHSFLLYTLRKKEQKVVIIDDKLNLLTTLKITPDFFDKGGYDVVWGGKIPPAPPSLGYDSANSSVLFIAEIKKKKNTNIYGNIYDPKTGNLISSTLLQKQDKKTVTLTKFSPKQNFFSLYSNEKKSNSWGVKLLDSKMNELGNWNYNLAKGEELKGYFVSNKGIILMGVYNASKSIRKLILFKEGKKAKEFILKSKEKSKKYGDYAEFIQHSEQKISYVTLTNAPKGGMATLSIFNVDPMNERIITSSSTAITKNTLEASYSQIENEIVRTGKAKVPKKINYKLRDIFQKDGSTYVVLEDLDIDTNSTGKMDIVKFSAKHMLIMAFDPSLKNDWSTPIIREIYNTERMESVNKSTTWTIIQSLSWMGNNKLHLLIPDANGKLRTVFHQTIDLSSGSKSTPVDLYPEIEDQKYYVFPIFCPLSSDRIMLHYRQGWGASKKISELKIINFE